MSALKTPNPFITCPECGAPPRTPHRDGCRWSYQNMRSKMRTIEEALMQETEEPQPAPEPEPQPEPQPGEPDGGDDAEGE